MKLSTKGRYGVRLMVDLAIHGVNGQVLLKDVARRQAISEKYMGHLVPLLKNAGLINTARGAHGGFSLAKPANEITLKDIIGAVEGPIFLVGCVEDESSCKRVPECAAHDFWAEATLRIHKVLESYNLADLAQRQKDKTDAFSYVI